MQDTSYFYNKYKILVYNVALNYTGNKEDAEEITQDVFVKIFKTRSSFNNKSKIETWIYRITINASLDYLKSKNRLKRRFLNNYLTLDNIKNSNYSDFNHPGVLLIYKEDVKRIYNCINELPDNYRNIIILLKIENKSYKEASEILDISIKAAEALFSRAKKKLEKLLKIEDN